MKIYTMKITLKNVKTFTGREGIGLNATMYVDGIRTASVIDEGNGGSFFYTVFDRAKYTALEDHIKHLPERTMDTNGKPFSYPPGMDDLVNDAFAEYEHAKLRKRAEKDMHDNIVAGVLEGDDAGFITYMHGSGKPIAQLTPEQVQKMIASVKQMLSTNEKHRHYKILNTNLPEGIEI